MQIEHRFQIRGELGAGGFATVHRAFDVLLGRDVALKVLHPHIAADPEERGRFLREGVALRRLRHPNIVTLLESGEDGEHVWHAMELIEGQSLAESVEKQGPLSDMAVSAIAVQLASALAALHARGLIHRDIKPANIHIERGSGRAVLLDLGVARDQRNLSRPAGVIVGTPAYMAPEQIIAGGEITTRTDVYQLGATLYALLTGQPPFTGSQYTVLEAVRRLEPRPPRQVRESLSEPAAAVLMQALAKQPALRPAGPRELVDALTAALAQHAELAPAPVDSSTEDSRVAVAPACQPAAAIALPVAAVSPAIHEPAPFLPLAVAPAGNPSPSPRPARAARGGDTLCGPIDHAPAYPYAPAPVASSPVWAPAPAWGVPAPAWGVPAQYPAASAWQTPAPRPPAGNRNRWLAAAAGLAVLVGAVITLRPGDNARASVPAAPIGTAPSVPGAPGASPVAPAPAENAVLLRDDFNDPSRGVLPRQSPNPNHVRMGYDRGEYLLEKYNPNAEGFTPVLVGAFDNATVTIEARLTGETQGRAIAVGCRASREGWYQLSFDPNTGLSVIERMEANASTPLTRPAPAPKYNRGGKNQLSLTCAGNQIRARINGVEVARATDSRFKKGQSAFLVFAPTNERATAGARFDNLLIEAAKP